MSTNSTRLLREQGQLYGTGYRHVAVVAVGSSYVVVETNADGSVAKDLISRLLTLNPERRLSADRITDQPWFRVAMECLQSSVSTKRRMSLPLREGVADALPSGVCTPTPRKHLTIDALTLCFMALLSCCVFIFW